MKIAIQLDNDRNIIGTVTTNELGAELQVKLFKDKGWVLVDGDPAFSVDQMSQWTIRQTDNKLVYISDNKTSDERNQLTITELTKGNLNNQMTGVQLQTAVTALTKSNLQLTLDNTQLNADSSTQQAAITALTTELMNQQLKSAATTDTTK